MRGVFWSKIKSAGSSILEAHPYKFISDENEHVDGQTEGRERPILGFPFAYMQIMHLFVPP